MRNSRLVSQSRQNSLRLESARGSCSRSAWCCFRRSPAAVRTSPRKSRSNTPRTRGASTKRRCGRTSKATGKTRSSCSRGQAQVRLQPLRAAGRAADRRRRLPPGEVRRGHQRLQGVRPRLPERSRGPVRALQGGQGAVRSVEPVVPAAAARGARPGGGQRRLRHRSRASSPTIPNYRAPASSSTCSRS